MSAAEQIGWPIPVDYSACSESDRTVFESSFMNLLRLQTM